MRDQWTGRLSHSYEGESRVNLAGVVKRNLVLFAVKYEKYSNCATVSPSIEIVKLNYYFCMGLPLHYKDLMLIFAQGIQLPYPLLLQVSSFMQPISQSLYSTVPQLVDSAVMLLYTMQDQRSWVVSEDTEGHPQSGAFGEKKSTARGKRYW